MKKLAIIGSGPDTRDLAPWDDLSFDIWVFNEAPTADWCKRWDALFQMHEPSLYQGFNTKDPHHWDWLQQKHGKPIYMQEVDPLVPDSVQFPLDEIVGLTGYRYLASTVADAIALAATKYGEIHMWGVELSMTEYQYQAECIRFWVGYAKGKLGDKFQMHCAEKLFEAPLYGYEGNFAFGKEFFEERRNILDAKWTRQELDLKNLKTKLERAVSEMKFHKAPALIQQFQRLALETGEISGALAEAEAYAAYGDRIADRGKFEFNAATGQREGDEKQRFMFMALGQLEMVGRMWEQTKTNAATTSLLQILSKVGELAYDAGAQLGRYRENISYILKYDQMYQANGMPIIAKSMDQAMAEMAVTK